MILTRRFGLGLLITLGFLLLFLWKLDIGETGRSIRDASYIYLAPAIVLYFVALGFRSLRWHYLLLHLKSISPLRLYPVVVIAYMSNNLLPLRIGELVRAHFLGEREGVNKASGLATVGVERVLDGLTLLFLAAVVWPFLPWTDVLKDDTGELNTLWVVLSALVILLFVGGFLVLAILSAFPGFARRLTDRLTNLLPDSTRPKIQNLVYQLIDGLGALRSPQKLIIISLLSAPVWLIEASIYYLIAISFDLNQPFHVILLVTATSNLATAIPSSIGGIGPFEVVAKSTLIAFGVGPEVAAAYAFFVHIVALWLPVNILGLAFLWRENISLGQIVRNKQITSVTAVPPGMTFAPPGHGASPEQGE